MSVLRMVDQFKVLSIQSHVVSGYVGNKSACFPLQVLGIEVDFINSVQFSNHTEYGLLKGQVLDEKELGNRLDRSYTHLLTGYIGSTGFLHKVAEVVKYLKDICPNMSYICDPVMGDNGHMYVPKELLPIYRDTIVPLADIITPNQYEVELLIGKSINQLSDMWAAIDWFHQQGVKTVAISSSQLGTGKNLLALASSIAEGKKSQVTIEIPLLDATFTGTGDLFAALFLAWMAKSEGELSEAMEKTVSTLQAVLRRTLEMAKLNAGEEGKLSVQDLELRLIQSKQDIENPVVTIKAKRIIYKIEESFYK
uniref:Pyridoxal kinase n=1 Tax=Graphocephala atropunctata TaxID=36148 RepID=A0A1B6KMD8_9HEMI